MAMPKNRECAVVA